MLSKQAKYTDYTVTEYYPERFDYVDSKGDNVEHNDIVPVVQVVSTTNDFFNELLQTYRDVHKIQKHDNIWFACKNIRFNLSSYDIRVIIRGKNGKNSSAQIIYQHMTKPIFDVMCTGDFIDQDELPIYEDDKVKIFVHLFCDLPIVECIRIIFPNDRHIFISELYITSDDIFSLNEKCINITKDIIQRIEYVGNEITIDGVTIIPFEHSAKMNELFYQLYNRNTKSANKV